MARRTAFDWGMALLDKAKKEPNKKVKQLYIDSASEYFDVHIEQLKQSVRKESIFPHILLFLYFVVITGSIIASFYFLGVWQTIVIFIIEMAVLPMINGFHLRMIGKISEAGLIEIYKYGFSNLINFWRKQDRTNNPDSE